jgi:hypothetical protein
MQPKQEQNNTEFNTTSENDQVGYSQNSDVYEEESRGSEILNKLKEMLSSFFGE